VFAKGQALFSGSTNFRMASGSSGQDIRSSGGQSGVRSADHGRLRCWPTYGKAALGPCIVLADALRIIGVATKKACDHLLSAYSGRATEFATQAWPARWPIFGNLLCRARMKKYVDQHHLPPNAGASIGLTSAPVGSGPSVVARGSSPILIGSPNNFGSASPSPSWLSWSNA